MRRKGGKSSLDGQQVCLLSVKDAAEFLGVTPKTVRKWLNDKDHPLQGVKINARSWRIVEGDLMDFLRNNYVGKQ
jgi:excisionase family DNA binding protein